VDTESDDEKVIGQKENMKKKEKENRKWASSSF